ncbi:hypothetical protein [Streptomyces goshikiensis]
MERKQIVKQAAHSPCAPASATPLLRAERYDELVKFGDAGTAKPPQRTHEKVWQGQCGPDFTIEDGENNYRVRPVHCVFAGSRRVLRRPAGTALR